MRVRNDPVTVIAGSERIPLEIFGEGALGVNAEVRRPAYFLSQRILAEDEKFLPEKFHVIFMGIVYL